jgi:SSS family solute:Na+ symporter
MKTEFFVFLLIYFGLLFLASFLFSRRIKSLEDFFLASRNLPASLVYLTLAASWLGATSVLVSMDEAFERGLSSFWVMGIPAILTVLVFAFFLTSPIRRLPIVSLPDLVEMRYGRCVRHMTSFLIVWYMVLLAASQMVAMGKFLQTFLGSSYVICLILGTIVVLLYSLFGGFFSVVVTDSFQFFLLVIGIFGLFAFLLSRSSMSEVTALASQVGRNDYFNLFFDLKRNLLMAFSFTLAWIISPIVWQRIQAAGSDKKARLGLSAAGGTFFIMYGMILLIGVLSLPVVSSVYKEGHILSFLIFSKSGSFLGGILFIAVTAAVMSTMDTAINTGALSLTRDFYQQIFPSTWKKKNAGAGRMATLIVGLMAFLIASRMQSILKTLGLASEIMAEGLFIPGMAMIFLRKKLPWAGFLSLLFGGCYSIIGFLCQVGILRLNWPEWPYSVPYGLALSAVGFVLGLLISSLRGTKPSLSSRGQPTSRQPTPPLH